MARRSQWDNPKMWEQCRVWKDGGMTYTEICGQPARTENLQRFGLHRVPSEDTVTREVIRLRSRSPKPEIGLSPHVQGVPSGSDEVDIELGPHWRELYYFGKCFRDRLAIPDPDRVVVPVLKGKRTVLPWTGHSSEVVHGPIQQAVDNEWDASGYDATQHSLFPSFKQHLQDYDCWDQLESILQMFDAYIEQCQDMVSWLFAEVSGSEGVGLDELQAGTFIEALMTHSWHHKISSIRLFMPVVQQTNLGRTKGGGSVWGMAYHLR